MYCISYSARPQITRGRGGGIQYRLCLIVIGTPIEVFLRRSYLYNENLIRVKRNLYTQMPTSRREYNADIYS